MATVILNNRRNDASQASPNVYFTIEYTANRTSANSVTLTITCKAHLEASGSKLADSGWIDGIITINGTQYRWNIKPSNEHWYGTTVYTHSTTVTINNLTWNQDKLTPIYFKTVVSYNNTGKIANNVSCSDITFNKCNAPRYIKNNDTWVSGEIYVKKNNVWKKPNKVYIKNNNTWIEC